MKNLKRALSLALASVMVLGMMVVGAGAAEFNDADDIVNTDAVNTLVSLGIIKGKDTGAFDPEGIVTRAEMTKMICVALNGGKDPNLTGGGKYPDTKNHWASGYIDYCANQGIVSGDTAGNFNPDKTITGTEAAKMILIAIGYNAENEKFVNDAAWATNIGVRASQKNLYEDLALLPSEGLSRDNAAQMLYNGMQADMVEYDYKLGTSGGDLTSIAIAKDMSPAKTILSDKFSMITKYGFMTDVSYDSDKEEFTYSMNDGTAFGLASSDKIDSADKAPSSMKAEKDYSAFIGMQVKVLYKVANNKTTVYGMYATDSEVLYEGVGKDLPATIKATDDSVKLDGTTYKLTQTAADVKVFPYNVTTSTGNLNAKFANELAFALIDNTGDGKADIVITYPVTVAKVTFVGKDSITAGNVSYKFEDADIYEDVKKDDYVVVTAGANTAKDVPVIAKAEILTGEVEATRTTEVKVDGTWYKDASTKGGESYKIGDTFELVVVNGFVYNAKKTSSTAAATDTLYILGADPYSDVGTKKGKQTVEALFADGSKKVITVDKTNFNPATANDLEDIGSNSGNNKLDTAVNMIFSYATDKDGNYELSKIKASDYDATGAADGSKGIKIEDGKAAIVSGGTGFGTMRFNDNAVVFVKGTDKVKALSGADINKWAATTTTTAAAGNVLYANEKNGFNYVELGMLNVDDKVPGADGDKTYGWITGTPSLVKSGDDYYIEVSLWNGEETVTVLAESTASTNVSSSTTNTNVADDVNVKKGTPVSYKDLGADKVSDVTSLTGKIDAVTGYAGGKDIEFLAKGGEITDDTAIVYVNTADNEGVVGGSISVADKDVNDDFIKNVYADVDGNGDVLFIIIDTANNLKANKGITSVTGSVVTAVSDSDKTMTVAKATDVDGLIGEIDGWDGYSSATVYNGNTEVTEGSTALTTGNTVRVVGLDGKFIVYTITVAV